MNNTRFLLEFCEDNDVIEMSIELKNYLQATYRGIVFDEIVAASKLVAHQKLDVNTYIETVGK